MLLIGVVFGVLGSVAMEAKRRTVMAVEVEKVEIQLMVMVETVAMEVR